MRSLLPLFPILVILLGIFGSILLLGVLRDKIEEGGADRSVSGNPQYLATIAAKADLARKLNRRADDVQVASIQAVNWPDTSLGCPEPGMVYAQVLTPGFLLVLEAVDQRFEYHTSEAESAAETAVVDCTDHPNPAPGVPRGLR